MRIRYKYRRMILRGEIKVSHEAAVKLVGPDCAFHLYGIYSGESGKSKVKRKRVRKL